MPEVRVNIVGVGNLLMGDDGVGPAAIERLGVLPLDDGVRLYDAGLAVSDVLCRLDPDDPLIVIDALRTGGRPGRTCRVLLTDLQEQAAPGGLAISLHEMSVLPTLRMEELLGRKFRHVVIFGVEPKALGWSCGLSPEVDEAMGALVDAVRKCAQELVENETAAAPCAGAAYGEISP